MSSPSDGGAMAMAATPRSALDAPVEHATFAFIDLEMTGLDPAVDRVIEICVERVSGGEVVSRIDTLVRPEPPPATTNSDVHGIQRQDWSEAPRFAEVADGLVAALANAVLVAHAAKHDVAFMRAEFARLNRAWRPPPYVDTLPLSRSLFDAERHSLDAIARRLGIANPQQHRAANDVRVLRALFEQLVARAEAKTARDLLRAYAAREHDAQAVVAAAQKAAAVGSIVQLRYRPRGKPAQQLSFCVTGVRSDLDPPRVLGYLHPSRGRRELRADRILSIEPLES